MFGVTSLVRWARLTLALQLSEPGSIALCSSWAGPYAWLKNDRRDRIRTGVSAAGGDRQAHPETET